LLVWFQGAIFGFLVLLRDTILLGKVGTVGGGTGYETQKKALELLKCAAPGMKGRLTGLIAAFALALDASTSAAIANDTFTESQRISLFKFRLKSTRALSHVLST
jgi:hypothetical protein